MPRFALILILALLPLATQAAKKADTVQPVTSLSDEEVVQQLGTSDILAWERAQQLKKEGQSLVDTGTRLMERQPSPLRDAQDVARDKADGKRMVDEGNAKLAEAEKALNVLRLKVSEEAPEEGQTLSATVYKLDLEPQSFSDEILSRVIERQLFDLWGLGYKRILLVGAWVSTTEATTTLPEFRARMEDEMRRKDGNRYSIIPTDTSDYLYLVVNGKPTVNFPDKVQTLNNYRTALVYAELIASPDRKETWISLRAVDAKSLDLIDARLMLCKNDSDLDELLSIEEEEKSEEVSARPLEPIAIVINDEADFVSRVRASNASYQFGIRYLGDGSGFRARQSAVLLKTLFPPKGVKMSDVDFFARALPSDEESADAEVRYDALWQLEPQEPGLPLRQTYALEAISLKGDEERSLEVGTMEVASASAPAPESTQP